MNRFQYIVVLQNNLFPPELIDKVFINYFTDQFNTKESPNKRKGCFFKIPHVGFFSKHTQNKIKEINKKLCSDDINISLVFAP